VLLGIPYQELHHIVYHAHNHQYHLQKYGSYLCPHLILSEIPYLTFWPTCCSSNQSQQIHFPLLVHPLKPDIPSHALPSDMDTLLTSFEDVFVAPTRLPPFCSIEHSIDLIPGATFPNAPSYHLAPHEAEEVEHQLQQLLNTSHIQLISSPCASPSFIIPKKEFEEWHLVMDYQGS
jgi:hypothetical protein